MVTIFATPRPFTGEFDVIQRNAIASWTRLHPRPQVIIFGEGEGLAQACQDLGVEHELNVRVNEFGTPLADSMIELAERRALHPLMLWIAADNVVFQDAIGAARDVSARFTKFCMIVGRYHAKVDTPIEFDDPTWESRLRARAKPPRLEELPAGDFFLFPKGFWGEFPPFAEGRTALDCWMFYRALQLGGALVDATQAVMTVHLDHGYSHPEGQAGVFTSIEGERNFELAGGHAHMFTRENADWYLTPEGIRRPPITFRRHLAYCRRLAAFHPWAARVLRSYHWRASKVLGRLGLLEPADPGPTRSEGRT